MQKEKITLLETLLEDYRESLIEELNIHDNPSDKELHNILVFIVKQYEREFENDFSDIFIYNYYKNILNNYNNTMNKILNFVKTKKTFENDGKDEAIQAERRDCEDVLYLYKLKISNRPNVLISQITGHEIPVNQSVINIITNNDIFVIPPKGKPELRGPHNNYTIEYSIDYWENFKKQITKYTQDFEKNHSQDFLEDLADYRFWLNQYNIFDIYINNEEEKKEGEKHVKN